MDDISTNINKTIANNYLSLKTLK